MVSINDREMQVMRCSLVKRRNVRWAGISSGRLMRYVTPRDLRTVVAAVEKHTPLSAHFHRFRQRAQTVYSTCSVPAATPFLVKAELTPHAPDDALPPYSPAQTFAATTRRPGSRPSIALLPLHLLHRIVSLTLDSRATPSRFSADPQEERVRRVWALFRGLRGVDRRFYLGALSFPTLSTHSSMV